MMRTSPRGRGLGRAAGGGGRVTGWAAGREGLGRARSGRVTVRPRVAVDLIGLRAIATHGEQQQQQQQPGGVVVYVIWPGRQATAGGGVVFGVYQYMHATHTYTRCGKFGRARAFYRAARPRNGKMVSYLLACCVQASKYMRKIERARALCRVARPRDGKTVSNLLACCVLKYCVSFSTRPLPFPCQRLAGWRREI